MTHLDFAILGLLLQRPSTGYEVRKTFETTAMGNYSSSPGSIYPALKKLQKLRMAVQKQDDSGRKLFYITEKGEDEFRIWLTKPIKKDDVAKRLDILLLRFAFMDDQIPRDKVVSFLNSLRVLLKEYIAELENYAAGEGAKLKPCAGLAFEHGVVSHKTTFKWTQKALMKIKQ